jgi:hypothetical protein
MRSKILTTTTAFAVAAGIAASPVCPAFAGDQGVSTAKLARMIAFIRVAASEVESCPEDVIGEGNTQALYDGAGENVPSEDQIEAQEDDLRAFDKKIGPAKWCEAYASEMAQATAIAKRPESPDQHFHLESLLEQLAEMAQFVPLADSVCAAQENVAAIPVLEAGISAEGHSPSNEELKAARACLLDLRAKIGDVAWCSLYGVEVSFALGVVQNAPTMAAALQEHYRRFGHY